MARRKKPSPPRVDEAPSLPAPAPRIGTSFAELFAEAQRRRPERPAKITVPPPVLPAPGPAPLVPIPSQVPPAPEPLPPPDRPKPTPRERPEGAADASVLSPAEQAALQRAFAGVRPIARPARGRRPAAPGARVRPSEPPDPVLERAARERLASLVSGGVRFELRRDGDEVTGLGTGVDERLLGRLRGGAFAPEATLDLHGLRAAEVPARLERFVRDAKRAGRRYLLLIHGKGSHSPDGVGVLGEAVLDALLGGGAAPVVAAFATAHGRLGGTGALAVALR